MYLKAAILLLYFEDYVDDIYETMVDAIVNNKLKDVIDKIKAETPPPINKMLNKQPLSEAIRKKNMQECMPIVDVQPTNSGNLFKINPTCTSVDQDLQGYPPLCTVTVNPPLYSSRIKCLFISVVFILF